MKNILFLTDLDGTLLDPQKKIPPHSEKILNMLIKSGVKFTISTARTPATLEEILKNTALNLPVCVMNGAAIYDTKEEKYIHYHSMDSETVFTLTDLCKKHCINPFIHMIKDDRLIISYEKVDNPAARDFHNERKNLRLKTYVNAPYSPDLGDAVYLTILDREEKTRALYEEAADSPIGKYVNLNFYRDVYNSGYFYLEICSKNASKETGLLWLKKFANAELVYAFGDNTNDLPMLAAADKSFAVENAAPEVKAFCTEVIGKNTENSVAEKINQCVMDEIYERNVL